MPSEKLHRSVQHGRPLIVLAVCTEIPANCNLSDVFPTPMYILEDKWLPRFKETIQPKTRFSWNCCDLFARLHFGGRLSDFKVNRKNGVLRCVRIRYSNSCVRGFRIQACVFSSVISLLLLDFIAIFICYSFFETEIVLWTVSLSPFCFVTVTFSKNKCNILVYWVGRRQFCFKNKSLYHELWKKKLSTLWKWDGTIVGR